MLDNPARRLALALSASLLTALLSDTLMLLLATACGLLLLLLAARQYPAGLRLLLRRWATLNLFIAAIWLVLPWRLDDQGLQWSAAGLETALAISLRSNAIGLFCIALISHMDAMTLTRAATTLGLPSRLSRLLALTIRYLELMHSTRNKLQRAMQARGFHPRRNRRTVQVLAMQVALILVHALLKAERAELAQRARGLGAAPTVRPTATFDALANREHLA